MRKRILSLLLLAAGLLFAAWFIAPAEHAHAAATTHTCITLQSAPSPVSTPTAVATATDESHAPQTVTHQASSPLNSFIQWLTSPLPNENIVIFALGLLVSLIIAVWGFGRKRFKAWRQKNAEKRALPEYVRQYRNRLTEDPNIAYVTALDVDHQMRVEDVYIKLRLHTSQRRSFALDPAVLEIMEQRDPLDYFAASRSYRESRARQALLPEDVFRSQKSKRYIITGDPGSGKTTLLKYLALQSAQGKLSGLPDFPIYIALNDFAREGLSKPAPGQVYPAPETDLLRYAAIQCIKGFPGEEALKYLQEQQEAKECNILFLLDALDETAVGPDEISQRFTQQRILKAVEGLSHRFEQAYIVMTARKAGYQQLEGGVPGFTALEVLDFIPDDIYAFVRKWPFQDPSKATTLIEALDEKNPRLFALAANPLLLSLIAMVHDENLELPKQRTGLYQACINKLMSKANKGSYILPPQVFDAWQKRYILADVAWAFQLGGARYLPDRNILPIIGDGLPDINMAPEQAERALRQLDIGDGLLRAQTNDSHGFLHLTLQEYFAALWAAQEHRKNRQLSDTEMLDRLLAHRNDPQWEEVILLYAGCVDDAEPLFQRLLSGDDIFSSNINLAGRCLAADPVMKRIEQVRREVIERLQETLVNTPSSLTRQRTAETLAELARVKPSVKQTLLALLDDNKDEQVSKSIVDAFGEYGASALAQDLLPLLLRQDLSWDLRDQIADVIARLRNRSILPDLWKLVKQSSGTDACQYALDIIGNLGDASQAQELLRLVQDAQVDAAVRARAALALGTLGDRAVVQPLVDLLADTTTRPPALGIVVALARLRDHSITGRLRPLLAEQSLPLDVRMEIADTLVELTDQGCYGELLPYLDDATLALEVRETLARALGIRGDATIIPGLKQSLGKAASNPRLRQSILLALAMLGDHSVDAEVQKSLEQSSYILGSIMRRIAEHLDSVTRRNMLENRRLPLSARVAVVQTMTGAPEATDPETIATLSRLASDHTELTDVRKSCIAALGSLARDKATAEMLARIMKDEPGLRDDAQRALWGVTRRGGLRARENRYSGNVEITLDNPPRE
jgi:HEAT repeat protein